MTRRKGFTLVELLSVLVILAILVLIVANLVTRNVQNAKEEVSESQEKSILNAAEKWSIEHSDAFDDVEGTTINVGLDLVFVVDVSGSMAEKLSGSSTTRYEGTQNAINSALEILKQSEKNRVGFAFYSGLTSSRGSCENVAGTANKDCSVVASFPLTPVSSIQEITHGQHYWHNNRREGKVPYFTVNGKLVDINGGTYTLIGIQKARDLFLNANDKESRIPVVVLLTDGEPTYGRKYNESNIFGEANSSLGNGTTNKLTENPSTNSEIIWSIMKTSYELKKDLNQKYQADVYYYTIGIGITSKYGTFMLNPSQDNYAALSESTNKLDKNLYTFINGKSDKNYNYPTQSFTGEISAEALKNIFVDIATQVTEATKVTSVCVTVEDLYKDGYLTTKDIELEGKSAATQDVLMNYSEATHQYSFNLVKTEEQQKICNAYRASKEA